MKRATTCPYCDATSRVGPAGQVDGVIEPWGKSVDKLVFHCTACDGIFLGRFRLLGGMRAWTLGEDEQRHVRSIRHTEAGFDGRPAQQRGRGEIECPVCGKHFVTQTAMQAHTESKHPDAT